MGDAPGAGRFLGFGADIGIYMHSAPGARTARSCEGALNGTPAVYALAGALLMCDTTDTTTTTAKTVLRWAGRWEP